MKNRITLKLTAILLSMLMAAMMLMTIFREKGLSSYNENRKLASIPELTVSSILDGSWFRGVGEYFSDHFAGRSYLVTAKGELEAGFGESMVNGVYITESRLLDTKTRTFGSAAETAGIIDRFFNSYNGTVHIAVIPSSAGVYNDRLPEYFQSSAEKQQIDDFYSQLDTEIRKIDAYNILKMLNTEYIYYRNDTKWTSYGAYCVYRTVIQKLGFQPTAYDKYTIEHVTGEFRGDLYNRTQYSKLKADILDIYTCTDGAEAVRCTGYRNDGTSFETSLYDRAYIDSNDKYRLYLGVSAPLVRIETNVNNDRKLLVIKDDYANCFIPFLLQHYSEIAVVSPESLESELSGLINSNEYEQTLFLFGSNGFSDIDSLALINE